MTSKKVRTPLMCFQQDLTEDWPEVSSRAGDPSELRKAGVARFLTHDRVVDVEEGDLFGRFTQRGPASRSPADPNEPGA
ncbi:MAG: hypothetical protein ABI647_12415 [Gemmatimonadota bacterium]